MNSLTDKKKKYIFLCIVVSGIATSMLATAMTTALPNVMEYFRISTAIGQWITSGYSLAMGITLPLTAYLITKFPTKKLYLSGLVVFLVGLLFSIFAPTFKVMMFGRVFQAIGNAVLMSSAQVIILTIYEKEKKGTMMGMYGLATTAAPIIAPTLAGLMIDAFGWKSIFEIAFIFIVISIIVTIFIFENVIELQDRHFDIISFVQSILAFGGVTLGIGNIITYGIFSIMTLLPLLIGLIGSILFVIRQISLDVPFLDVKILVNKNYAVSVLASVLLYFVMMGSSVMIPIYVQTIMKKSAVISGIVTLPGSFASALISPFAGKIYDKMGIKKLFVIASIALIISSFGMVTISITTALWIAVIWNLVRSVAIGALMMPLLTWGTSYVDSAKVSDASSLLTSLRTIAGAIGSVVFVGIMNIVYNNSIEVYADTALMHGFNVAFLLMMVISVIMLLISLFGVAK